MTGRIAETTHAPARRGFFGRLGAAAAVGFGALLASPVDAHAATQAGDGPHWPGRLKGRHRQVVDAYEVNDGYPLTFALSFLAPNPPGSATAVIILRHAAFPIALNSAMWAKYRIGESRKIDDPETQAPAVKNPFLHPKPGMLRVDAMAVDRLLAVGTVIGACNLALLALSKQLAGNAGVSAEEAAREWAANIVPGITVIPSGTWGLNRAQEAGCSYCAGG